MINVAEKSVDQERWNKLGTERLKKIEQNSEDYIISDCPIHYLGCYKELIELISPIQGKRILEIGCGTGDFSVWLAKQGAIVTGVDIGADLIAGAKVLAKANQVECKFQQGDITALQFVDPNTYDIVIGLSILHHLSKADVLKAVRECHRIMNAEGIAIFYEPIENSKIFDFIQNLFPAGKRGSSCYRPSILQRSAWVKYIEVLDDRTMTNQELIVAGRGLFSNIRISPYGFLHRLGRLIGNYHCNTLMTFDAFLFKVLPPLKYYSQSVLVEYRK